MVVAKPTGDTHGEVLLICEHKLGGVGVVGAVRLIDAEFIFLLFRKQAIESDNGTSQKRTRVCCLQLAGRLVPTAGLATAARQCPRAG